MTKEKNYTNILCAHTTYERLSSSECPLKWQSVL